MQRWKVAVRRHEEALFWWVHRRWARAWLDRVMRLLTHAGSWWSCMGISTALWAFPTSRTLAVATAISVVTSHLPVQLLKRTVQRPRPYFALQGYRKLVAPLTDYSFPSGHTAAAFAMAGILSTSGLPIALVSWSLAIIVGISRMYLGHHYPLDVAFGAVLGIAGAVLGRALVLA
ncbi:MAG: phosphatase PAP2 family protein [Limnochordales bacterium]|nr:phosphatase PAP2 family protein [Limnochordales bacterium]